MNNEYVLINSMPGTFGSRFLLDLLPVVWQALLVMMMQLPKTYS